MAINSDSSDSGGPGDWRIAFEALIAAQAEMLRWYREIHGPALRAGDILRLETGYEERNAAILEKRLCLLTLPAPDWRALLIKLENLSWLSDEITSEDVSEITQRLCSDLIRLAESFGVQLSAAPHNPHVGPAYAA